MNTARRAHPSGFNSELKLKGFKAYELTSKACGRSYHRNDFYRISLHTGRFVFHHADRSFEDRESVLFFCNPCIPYSYEVISQTDEYVSLFTEDFLKSSERLASLFNSSLVKLGGMPVLSLNSKQEASIATIFQKMITEQDSDYAYKDELIRDYMGLIIHEALKMQLT